jgi:hypothetical protein
LVVQNTESLNKKPEGLNKKPGKNAKSDKNKKQKRHPPVQRSYLFGPRPLNKNE